MVAVLKLVLAFTFNLIVFALVYLTSIFCDALGISNFRLIDIINNNFNVLQFIALFTLITLIMDIISSYIMRSIIEKILIKEGTHDDQ